MDAEYADDSLALRPARRTDQLIVREVGDELVAYALDTEQVTALDPTAAAVWKQLNGESTIEEIAEATNLNETDVAIAVDQLDRSGLMAGGVDRRRFLRFATASAGAMALVSIAAPAAMAAGSSAVLSITTTGPGLGCNEMAKTLKGTVSGTNFPAGTYTVTVNATSANPAGTGTATVTGVVVTANGMLSKPFTVNFVGINLKKNSTTSASATAQGTSAGVSTVLRSTTTPATSDC